MYDKAEAARRRIRMSARGGGKVGALYLALADELMKGSDTAVRTLALKKLADSCDSAMSFLEKTQQPRLNSPDTRRSPP